MAYLLLIPEYQTHNIFPVEDLKIYEVGTYHESVDSNWTEAMFDTVAGKINFKYTLSNNLVEPFAAFYFRNADINGQLLNTKKYNSISIHLDSKNAQRIPISLRFKNDSLLKLSKNFPEISISAVIDYKEPGEYIIPLENFELAAWWLRHHGITKEDVDLMKFDQLKYLALGSCQALEPGKSDVISIGKVEFINDNSNHFYIIIIFIGLIILVIISHLVYSKKRKSISIKQIDVVNLSERKKNKADSIKNYIGINFSNQELSVKDIEKDLNITYHEIRKIFKEEIQDSFKNYLKTVRLIEVKRLLKNSDIGISEIAHKCGYGDIPYFNRQFKTNTGMTPKEFRDLDKK